LREKVEVTEVKIRWLGHSCFCFVSQDGTRIVTDPYDEGTGYVLPTVEADYTSVSHDHFDHSSTCAVGGRPQLITERGEFRLGDISVRGISTFHDDLGGIRMGPNTVYCFEIDGIRLCHLGDLGHLLNSQQRAEIGKVDILLIPVGGTYTLDAKAAVCVCQQLAPRVIIPMHYRTPSLAFPLDTVDSFLKEMGGGHYAHSSTVELDKQDLLSKINHVLVLDCP
jgi:L-ascorbate metabolism protein UlaG (beta-lactamase superfamily)